MIIDAHHHLWRYTAEEFDWLTGPLTPLRRDYLVADLLPTLASAGIAQTVVVQARQSLAETEWLLDCCRQTTQIAGVVGWAPLASPDFPHMLEKWSGERALKGLRHVLQGEADPNFLERHDFNRGIRALREANLVYDLLIYERQLPQTIAFVDRHPDQPFVLDHLGKPKAAASELEPWATHLQDLARRPNVVCKLSGLVTEADPSNWSPGQLTPYLDVAVSAFGPERLLAGSDWPVCLAGVSYTGWFDLLRTYFRSFTRREQDLIFGQNALRVYQLSSKT